MRDAYTKFDTAEPAVHGRAAHAEIDLGRKESATNSDREKLKRFRRENRTLKEESKILKETAVLFVTVIP